MPALGPIGLYDSGLGGLSVVQEVLRQLPGAPVLYFGDTARVPYGPRPAEEILAFNHEIVQGLLRAGAETIVIACNTSCAVALPELSATYHVPIVGPVAPGAQAAVAAARGKAGGVAVIATEGTVRSGAYGRAVRAIAPGTQVRELACPGFVPLVEAGVWDGPEAEAAVRATLAPLIAAPPAALVLGCTHYPHLAPVIARVLGPGVALVNPAAGAVAEAARLRGVDAPGPRPAHRYMVSGDPEPFFRMASVLLPGAVEVVEQVRFGAVPALS